MYIYSCLENSMDRGTWWATAHGSQRVRHDRATNTFTFSYITYVCIYRHCCLVTSVVSDSMRSYGLQPSRLLCPWDYLDDNTRVGCHVLLQGIFPTQGSNTGLLHCRQILHH